MRKTVAPDTCCQRLAELVRITIERAICHFRFRPVSTLENFGIRAVYTATVFEQHILYRKSVRDAFQIGDFSGFAVRHRIHLHLIPVCP